MAAYGFVYLLSNSYMANVYKIGCTERSPHQRAQEISSASGVPHPFDVQCFIEVENHQAVEQQFHKWLTNFRVSPNREFFHGADLAYFVSLFFHYQGKLSFTDVNASSDLLCADFYELANPYRKPPELTTEETAAREIARISGSASQDKEGGIDA